jgi:hypothetical protein
MTTATAQDVTLAILALDAFSEGYSPGMTLPNGTSVSNLRITVTVYSILNWMPTPDQRQRQQRDDRCALSADEPFDQLMRQFLARLAGAWYCFSESSTSPVRTSHGRGAIASSALGVGNGSRMALQPLKSLKTDPASARRDARAAKAAKRKWS